MVNKQASVRRASSLAKKTNEQQKPKNASDFVKFSRARIEFQILELQSELRLLEELSAMSDEEKRNALFGMLDKDGDGQLSAVELADGLRKIRGDVKFEESLSLAIERVMAFDTDRDGLLSRQEFDTLVDTLLSLIGCTFSELSEMLVLKVAFSDTGNTLAEDVVAATISDTVTERVKMDENLRFAMKDRRMKALFAIFDTSGTGVCDFRDVVVGMYKLMDGIDEASHAAVTALLFLDEKQTRELRYPDFARLILSVAASLPERVTFDDVADTLTRNASSAADLSDEYVLKHFTLDTTSKLLLNISDDVAFLDLSVVDLAKLDRLFDMFNLSHDGRISTKELALGLRKFQITTGMETTVGEATHVIHEFGKEEEGLDRQEFAKFMVNFAKSAGLELVNLLDFMIVVVALQENTEAELEYMSDLGGGRPIDPSYG